MVLHRGADLTEPLPARIERRNANERALCAGAGAGAFAAPVCGGRQVSGAVCVRAELVMKSRQTKINYVICMLV